MTKEALNAIKSALARVRPNEWFAQGDRHEVRVSSSYLPEQELIALCATGEGAGPRSAYIAACNPSAISSLISSYEAMERRVGELEEALTPFADVGELILAEAPPESNYWEAFASCDGQSYQISLEYLRRARSALTPTVEKVETPVKEKTK